MFYLAVLYANHIALSLLFKVLLGQISYDSDGLIIVSIGKNCRADSKVTLIVQ